MEIRIEKERDVVYLTIDGCPLRHWKRPNSAMTKDLIKLEIMCRVYSFKPTMQSLFVLHFSNYLYKVSSAEKNDIMFQFKEKCAVKHDNTGKNCPEEGIHKVDSDYLCERCYVNYVYRRKLLNFEDECNLFLSSTLE